MSFLPVIEGKSKLARIELFFSCLNLQRALRDDRFKLIRCPPVNVTQLLNLQTDSDEVQYLLKDPVHPGRIAMMTAQLAKAQNHYSDSQPLMADNPKISL